MIFVLAQGQGSRWEHETIPYKQLVPVGDTTVIERILSATDSLPVCTSEFASLLSDPYPHVSLREPTQDILSGIVETLGYFDFDEDTIFLLGDVVYSREMLNKILDHKALTVSFFGRVGSNQHTGKEASELFAVKIEKSFKRQFMINCRWVRERGDAKKLWDYHRLMSPEFIVSIYGDWTDDIDSQAEYEKFGKKLIELAEADGIL